MPRRKFLWLELASLLAFASLTACSRPGAANSGLIVQSEISPSPARVGAATVILSVADPGGHPASGAGISIEADMSHPGMSPVLADAKEISPGRYQAQLQFAMAGDWVILLHIVLPDGKKVERQIAVNGVRPN